MTSVLSDDRAPLARPPDGRRSDTAARPGAPAAGAGGGEHDGVPARNSWFERQLGEQWQPQGAGIYRLDRIQVV